MIDKNSLEIIEFNRDKIYEKLEYQSEPPGYKSNIPWIVQLQISHTNGRHYIDRVGKLKDYPIYNLPVPPFAGKNGLMLDIGNGWGRWLVAGANKNYIPFGIDIRLEFCEAARIVLKSLNKTGYVTVADLENIPFTNNAFNLVWSYSVMQHTHYNRLINSLQHVNRILRHDGFTILEFPNKKGIRNRRRRVQESELTKNNYNSWRVRYYTPEEYRQIIEKYLSNFSFKTHSFIGIGVLPEDLKYISLKNKILCSISLAGTALTKVMPYLSNYADSLYVQANKKSLNSDEINTVAINAFLNLHKANPGDNLNVIPLLQCPKYGGTITLSSDRKKAVSREAGIYYPIENDIPIMISSEAKSL